MRKCFSLCLLIAVFCALFWNNCFSFSDKAAVLLSLERTRIMEGPGGTAVTAGNHAGVDFSRFPFSRLAACLPT